jgi:hypothetical protein
MAPAEGREVTRGNQRCTEFNFKPAQTSSARAFCLPEHVRPCSPAAPPLTREIAIDARIFHHGS